MRRNGSCSVTCVSRRHSSGYLRLKAITVCASRGSMSSGPHLASFSTFAWPPGTWYEPRLKGNQSSGLSSRPRSSCQRNRGAKINTYTQPPTRPGTEQAFLTCRSDARLVRADSRPPGDQCHDVALQRLIRPLTRWRHTTTVEAMACPGSSGEPG